MGLHAWDDRCAGLAKSWEYYNLIVFAVFKFPGSKRIVVQERTKLDGNRISAPGH
jgi:hypothetical protein